MFNTQILIADAVARLIIMSDSTGDLSILKVRIAAIIDFLTQPLPKSILATHPNDLLPDFTIGDRAPECWDEWWCWATDETRGDEKWLQLVRYHNEGKNGVHATHDGRDWSGIPRDLVRLIDAIKTLQLDRACQTSDANFSEQFDSYHVSLTALFNNR